MPTKKTAPKKKYVSDKQAAADLANALMDLPDEWVFCRDMRHAWEIMEDFHIMANKGSRIQMLGRTLKCLRCQTHRRETYGKTTYGLEKLSQSYGYPDGYQIKGVPRGVKPQSIIQAEQYRRMLDRIAEAERAIKVAR